MVKLKKKHRSIADTTSGRRWTRQTETSPFEVHLSTHTIDHKFSAQISNFLFAMMSEKSVLEDNEIKDKPTAWWDVNRGITAHGGLKTMSTPLPTSRRR